MIAAERDAKVFSDAPCGVGSPVPLLSEVPLAAPVVSAAVVEIEPVSSPTPPPLDGGSAGDDVASTVVGTRVEVCSCASSSANPT
ncbi:MAG: hypothetical protein IAG13_17350 [Deltaproteobacteria bacterium]|nr:hypothetical protein [Nannocystaceae bacterium]